jgi:myo-inositol-1(or 4)-monophosphatase
MKSISANLNIMIKASEKASKALIRDFGEVEKLQVSVKGPLNFVSNADIKAEKIIIEELSKARKNYSILSEEDGSKIGKDKNNIWIIDPIDGTTNYLHGVPHFAISIALKSNNEIISGVIYDPIKDEMFYAEKNNGAYYNNQRIRVSKKKKLEDCLFATGGNISEKNKTNTNIIIRRSGSAALDMAYVAAGRFDGYFQKNLNIWDIAAGIIIIKEAGGIINEIDLSKNNNIKVLASNSSINDKLVKNLVNF